MKKISYIITLLLSINSYAQNMVENWTFYYDKDITNKIEYQEKNKKCNISEIKKFTYTEKYYKEIILNNNYKKFLDDFNAPKELSNILNVMPFEDAIKFIDKLILNIDSKTNIAFTYDYNVFLSLYENESNNKTNINIINKLYNNYLHKSIDLYFISWLNHFNLYCRFSENSEFEPLYFYWLKNSKQNIINTSKIRYSTTALKYFKIKNIDKIVNAVLDETSHGNGIYYLFCISSNVNLKSEDKKYLFERIKNYDFGKLYEDKYNMYHSTLKNLNENYKLPKKAKYLLPTDWMIRKLKKIIKIKPTTSYLIENKFDWSYYYKTETILSWIFQINGHKSAYYSVPEQMSVDKPFTDIFMDYFKSNYNISYSLETNEEIVELEICKNDRILKYTFPKESEYQIGQSFEFITNQLLESFGDKKRLIPFNFEYPLYFIVDNEQLRFIIEEFNLKLK